MGDDDGAVGGGIVDQFATYEDYLDSQISATDIYYLEDEDLARQLVELGYRGSGETLKRDEFMARKRAAEQARMNKLRSTPKALASASKDVTGFPFLASLAEREEMVRNGKLTTIIFIRDKNAKGQEARAPPARPHAHSAHAAPCHPPAHSAQGPSGGAAGAGAGRGRAYAAGP